MIWLQFVGSALVIIISATRLAAYGDAIGVRTRLGGMFIGTILLAGATSLPELLTAANSLHLHEPNLTAGDLFGSSMFNMLLLAILDLLFQRARILRQVALNHALSAALAVLLMAVVSFFVLADLDVQIGWVGIDSLAVIGLYLFGMWLLRNNRFAGATAPALPAAPAKPATSAKPAGEKLPSLRHALIGFGLSTAVLVIATPWMVRSAVGIAELTGLTTGVVGLLFVAVVTSFPEMVATVAAARIGAPDLAVGNLFGSNIFNMAILGVVDVFYTRGSLLAEITPTMSFACLIGLILTSLAGVGNVARFERRLVFVEIDAFMILLAYALGVWFLVGRGFVG